MSLLGSGLVSEGESGSRGRGFQAVKTLTRIPPCLGYLLALLVVSASQDPSLQVGSGDPGDRSLPDPGADAQGCRGGDGMVATGGDLGSPPFETHPLALTRFSGPLHRYRVLSGQNKPSGSSPVSSSER